MSQATAIATPGVGEFVLVRVDPEVNGVDELPAVVTTVDAEDGSFTATVFRPIGTTYVTGNGRLYGSTDELDALVAEHLRHLPKQEKGAPAYDLVDVLPWVAPARRITTAQASPAVTPAPAGDGTGQG